MSARIPSWDPASCRHLASRRSTRQASPGVGPREAYCRDCGVAVPGPVTWSPELIDRATVTRRSPGSSLLAAALEGA